MKNTIEPRQGSIRSVFLRLKYADLDTAGTGQAVTAIKISKGLYGSYVLSAFEMAKGFSNPLMENEQQIPVHKTVGGAHDELIA